MARICAEPKDWKDLQNKVGEILNQCNLSVEIEKKVQSVRSNIEIDVYAEEKIDNRAYKILCECKMWNSNIPQLYVHALRTAVNDIGANKGYIISTSSFQRGAIDSIENTNVELITWEEFQKEFFQSWYINYFSRKLHDIIKDDYDWTAIHFYDDFDVIEENKFRLLIEKHYFLLEISSHFPHFMFKDFPNRFSGIENKLPLIEKLNLEEWELENYLAMANEILEEREYSNLLNLIRNFAEPVYYELDKLDLYLEYDE